MISEADLPDPKLKGLRILLVEDEAMVAMLIESILDDLGCLVVECAASVPAALEAINSRQFDGALLDMKSRRLYCLSRRRDSERSGPAFCLCQRLWPDGRCRRALPARRRVEKAI